MRANSSSSLMVSLMLHAFVVGGLILATYIVARQTKEPPVIFELVAGEGNQVNELEAPALGNTLNPVKLDTAPRPDPSPPSEPEPVVKTEPTPTEAVETPPPVEKAPTKAPTKAPDKPKPVEKPKVDKTIAQEMNKKARISYKEYLKKHPTPKQTASTGAASGKAKAGPRVDAQGIAAGVQGGSKSNTRGGAGGKAMSREEADQMSTYISLLIQELKKAHEPPPGVSDRFETKVSFDITASGAILNPRIVKSSGDKTFDQSVLDAFLRMRSIGPTPNRRPDNWTVTFRMRDEA
jgi:colicin import membrane protein